MIKITCDCGNEATRVKKDNESTEPKFNVVEIRRGGVTIGIGFECLECGTKTDYVK